MSLSKYVLAYLKTNYFTACLIGLAAAHKKATPVFARLADSHRVSRPGAKNRLDLFLELYAASLLEPAAHARKRRRERTCH